MSALRAAWLGALLAALLSGCGPAAAPRAFEVGEHRGGFAVPAGWEVQDQGKALRLRSGGAEIALQDLGPAGPQGIRREVERARDLWQAGRVDEARWRLRNVPVPPDLFPSVAARDAFWSTWSGLSSDAAKDKPFEEIEPAFANVLGHVDTMPLRDLQALADAGLAALGHDQRRDVRSREATMVGGRDALVVETWNRLSHTSPQRMLFVLNDGYLLALYAALRADADSAAAFDSVRASLQFAPVGAAASERR